MAQVATPEFLSHLKSLYPEQPSHLENQWYLAAAVAFSASNLPEAVPFVFQYVMEDLRLEAHLTTDFANDALVLVRKIRDAVFKSAMISGIPKVINALGALNGVLPENLKDKMPMRNADVSIKDLAQAGQEYFYSTYGETAESTQTYLSDIWPDLGFFATTFAYGYVYNFPKILSGVETSFVMVAALVATDTPTQIKWHLQGAVRNGATLDEVRAIRNISVEVAKASGVVWKNEVPVI